MPASLKRPSLRERSVSLRGVSLLETIALLIIMSILAGVLAPAISRIIDRARMERVAKDELAIGQALLEFVADTGRQTFRTLPNNTTGQEVTVQLLVSDGDIPIGGGGANEWRAAVDFQSVDFLEFHLVTNNPGKDPNFRYPVPTDFPGNPTSPSWRGAYLNAPVGSDPWGNRYAVNVGFLAAGSLNDVVILSAGPDEEIDSQYAVDGFRPGDDDVSHLISPGSLGQ